MRRVTILLFAMLSAFGACDVCAASATGGPELSPLQREIAEQRDAMDGRQQALRLLDGAYARFKALPPEERARFDMRTLLRAVADLNVYFPGARLDVQSDLFAALDASGEAGPDEVRDLFRSLVAARRFDEARTLVVARAGLAFERLPERVDDEGSDPSKARLLVPDRPARVLRRIEAPLSTFDGVLIVSHPLCRYSRQAFLDIESSGDPAIALPSNRLVIAPPFGALELDAISRWNSEHPGWAHTIIDAPEPWRPVLRHFETPQFIFLREGREVARVVGWPGIGQRNALRLATEQWAKISLGDSPKSH